MATVVFKLYDGNKFIYRGENAPWIDTLDDVGSGFVSKVEKKHNATALEWWIDD